MGADRLAGLAQDSATIAPMTRFGERVVPNADMSRSWKLAWVCLIRLENAENQVAYGRRRIAQVETQLKTKDIASPPMAETNPVPTSAAQNDTSYVAFDSGVMDIDLSAPMDGLLNTSQFDPSPPANTIPDIDFGIDENFSWEMIGLGLEEPLPSREAIDEL